MSSCASVANGQPTPRAEDSEPTLSLLALTTLVPADELPQFSRGQLAETPPRVTLAKFKALDAARQQEVVAVVERAGDHYRPQASQRRAVGIPAKPLPTRSRSSCAHHGIDVAAPSSPAGSVTDRLSYSGLSGDRDSVNRVRATIAAPPARSNTQAAGSGVAATLDVAAAAALAPKFSRHRA